MGYLFNDFGIKPEKRNEADMLLDFHQFGAGAGFKISEKLELNVGAFYVLFVPVKVYSTEVTKVGGSSTTHYLSKNFDESRYSVGIGVTYRFTPDSSDKDSSDDDKPVKDAKKQPAAVKNAGKNLDNNTQQKKNKT